MSGRRLEPGDFPQEDETDEEADLAVIFENVLGFDGNGSGESSDDERANR